MVLRMESMSSNPSSSIWTILSCRLSSRMKSSLVQSRWAIRIRILHLDKTTEMDVRHLNSRIHHSNPTKRLHTFKLLNSNSSRYSYNSNNNNSNSNSNLRSQPSTTWWISIFSRQRVIIDSSMKTRVYFWKKWTIISKWVVQGEPTTTIIISKCSMLTATTSSNNHSSTSRQCFSHHNSLFSKTSWTSQVTTKTMEVKWSKWVASSNRTLW